MYIKDFTYGEYTLSDLGFMVASVNTSNPDSISMGSELSFTTVKHNASHTNLIVSADYNEVIKATFDIITTGLLNCNPLSDFDYILPNKIEFMMSWLNRTRYLKFQPIYEYDDNEMNGFDSIFFYGTFTNIEAIYIAGKVIGFTLTFESNSPFGYSHHTYDIEYGTTNAVGAFDIYDSSSEMGYSYPTNFEITLTKNCNIKLTNENEDNRHTIILNCKNGEKIKFDSFHKTITSNMRDDFGNDFNYVFPRLLKEFNVVNLNGGGTMDLVENHFYVLSNTGSGEYKPANVIKHVTFEYDAARKVGIFA